VDATCGAGKFCSGGVCAAKFLPGTPCGADTQCATGFCTDGVCCDQECGEQCQACNDPSNVGRCVAVVGRPHGGRAPCIGTASCAGQCDGKGIRACVLPSRLTECGKAVCAAGVAHDAPVCNGAGTCIAGSATDCYPFSCGPNEKTCATNCNGNADCANGLICQNGGCVPGPDAGLAPDGSAGTTGGGREGGTNGSGGNAAGGRAGQGGSTGVSGSGQAGTGGTITGVDGGAVDAGTKPPKEQSGDTGSCGCRIEERSTDSRDALGALVIGALVALRRRRKPRAGLESP
jgi:MYXO-CTERM domain-containing protein